GTSYTYANMDGKTSLIAQAANKAVAKGIFVVNAQGNEGAAAWHYMLTPADGDSVYSVGSVDGSGIWAGSGYGPTFDQQIKPDGVALGKGVSLIGGTCGVGASNGSSFASPIMCGAITCLWQAAPHLKVWELRQLLHMVSTQYNTPDNTVGFGMPDFCQAYGIATNTSDITQIDYTFTCYPNPTIDGAFDVRCYNKNMPAYSYALYDLQGKIVFKSQELHTSGFRCEALQQAAKGTYILVVSSGLKQYSHKIIKQ
nr:S8 family peptidase [Chitinophagaceae bacterium]